MNLKHILKVTGSVALSAVMATASIPVNVYAEENTSKTNESSDKQTASSTKKTINTSPTSNISFSHFLKGTSG